MKVEITIGAVRANLRNVDPSCLAARFFWVRAPCDNQHSIREMLRGTYLFFDWTSRGVGRPVVVITQE